LRPDDAVDVDAGRDDGLRIKPAGLDDLVDLGDRHARAGREDRTEVAGAATEDQVAVAIGLRGPDDGEVGPQRGLEDVATAVEDALLLAAGELGADARRGVE